MLRVLLSLAFLFGCGPAGAQTLPNGPGEPYTEREKLQAAGISGYPHGWTRLLHDGFYEAAASGKLLIVLFTQPTCGWCVALATVINHEPRIEALRTRAVLVAVDPRIDEDDKGNVAQLQRDLAVD